MGRLHTIGEQGDRPKLPGVLDDPLRRQVLSDLDPAEGPVALSVLAERVANSRDRGVTTVRSPGGDEDASDDATAAERIATLLHHVHLPKLDEYELIAYDHRTNTVRPNRRR